MKEKMNSKHPILYNISTQQIQIFLKAVELKNFSRTASYFHFTPSAISKNITSLEEELGIQLFIRGPHELIITPAGEMLAQEWRHLSGSINNSIIKVKEYQENSRSRILFGFVDSSDVIDDTVRRAILAYRSRNPKTWIVAEKHDMHRSVELLDLDMLDLIFTSSIETGFLEEKNLCWEKVFDTEVIAYVPRSNLLFDRDELSFEDLKSQPLVSLDLLMHPAYNDWLFSLCGSHGFAPNILSTFRTVRSLEFNLKLGSRIFIGENITTHLCDEDLRGFNLGVKNYTVLAWSRNADPEVLAFKDFMSRQLIQSH